MKLGEAFANWIKRERNAWAALKSKTQAKEPDMTNEDLMNEVAKVAAYVATLKQQLADALAAQPTPVIDQAVAALAALLPPAE